MALKSRTFGTFLFLILGYLIFYINYEKINIDLYEVNFDNLENNNKISKQINKLSNTSLDKNKNANIKTNNSLYKNTIIEVKKNQTFSSILNEHIESNKLKYEIIDKVNKIFDLRRLKVGQKINFFKNNNNKVEKIILYLDYETNLNVNINKSITVDKEILKKSIEKNSKEYFITDSLYLDGIKNLVPSDILIKLIRLFSFDLDFQRDIKKNTIVSVSYDEINIEGRDNIIFGDINYALIEIGKNNLEYFKFKTDDEYVDYFNREGKNVKKSILKTPIDGARLSSTYGMRKHPILGYNKMHRGIDFAAPTGTPVYAGGNGVIEFAGRNGSYGNYIRIRHNNEYKTAYAHLNGFNKGISKGVRVNQGQIIGFVGSTGRSTGPHLHYEIIYQNEQINPLKLKLPSGKILKGKELERFQKEYKIIYASHLNTLYE